MRAPAGTGVVADGPIASIAPLTHDDRLAGPGRSPGAVDDAGVGQRHHRRVDGDELADGVANRGALRR